MRLGTVKYYDKERGFGYIVPSNGGAGFKVFAHGIIDPIEQNCIVTFDLAFTKHGAEAVSVSVLHA